MFVNSWPTPYPQSAHMSTVDQAKIKESQRLRIALRALRL